MTTTINANTSAGLVYSADTSGIVKLQSNGVATNALMWVNFIGSTAVVRAGYNVSSISRTGTGQYTITFTNAMADANYAPQGTADFVGGNSPIVSVSDYTYGNPPSTTSFKVFVRDNAGSYIDAAGVYIAIFGN